MDKEATQIHRQWVSSDQPKELAVGGQKVPLGLTKRAYPPVPLRVRVFNSDLTSHAYTRGPILGSPLE